MKLRIRGNSIRLRLGQSEVAQLIETGRVQEATVFAPGQTLVYALSISQDLKEARSTFQQGRIEVCLPATLARAWAAGDEVGISAEQAGDPEPLRLLIEKDFACLKAPMNDDQSDAFPHPGCS